MSHEGDHWNNSVVSIGNLDSTIVISSLACVTTWKVPHCGFTLHSQFKFHQLGSKNEAVDLLVSKHYNKKKKKKKFQKIF